MTEADIQKVLNGELPPEVAITYLNIYIGTADWGKHLAKLYESVRNNSELMRQIICCTILTPTHNRHIKLYQDHPEQLLFGIRKFDHFDNQDWYKTFQKVVRQDLDINKWRRLSWAEGVIDPLEFSPNTRQAFNWLYAKAEESGAISSSNKEEVVQKLKNLVYAYGGAVICGIFTRHEEALKKVVNWRSGYFFERSIFDTYDIEQVLKIKKRELNSASEKLVKRVKTKAE